MKTLFAFATIFIATCAMPTGAWSQKVYKCGSSYSQIPCANAVTVDAGDARSTAQKTEADKQTTRDATAANAMEKTRLKEEAQAVADSRAAHKVAEKAKATATKAKTEAEEAKKKKKKGKEPEFFTAKTAPDQKADDAKK